MIDQLLEHRGPKTRVRGLDQFREDRIWARPSLTAELRWENQRARRRNASDCIKYLQPEPLMSRAPGYFGYVARRYGTQPNAYGYALDNPLAFYDPNGREVYAADPTAAGLLSQLQQNPAGAALYNYLNASPYIYNVSTTYLPSNLQNQEPLGQFSPGIASGRSTCNAGGNISLYNLEALAANRDPVGNLAHELTHAGLYDYQYLGRPGAPDVVTTFAGDSNNGALPPLPHSVMEGYWQGVFGGTP